MTQFYAIRQISTGYYLPQSHRRHRGYTNDEPTDKQPPRLFNNIGGAKHALRWWLEGAHYRHLITSNFGDELESIEVRKMPNRNKDDMQIVRVYITL